MGEQGTAEGVGLVKLADQWDALAEPLTAYEDQVAAYAYQRCAADLRRAVVAGRMDSDEDVMAAASDELARALGVGDLGRVPWAELLTFAATLVPREVHVVERDNIDGLYGFVDEGQADEYAALFEGAERATLIVNDERAGAEIIADERAELAENAEVLRWVCEDDAAARGYDVDSYRGGRWVLETGDDAEGWIMDLPDAPISGEAIGPWLLDRYRVRLGKPMPANCGTAYAVESSR